MAATKRELAVLMRMAAAYLATRAPNDAMAVEIVEDLRKNANEVDPKVCFEEEDEPVPKPPERFCVIGEASRGVNVFNRTWFTSREKAAQHAKDLLWRSGDGELLIVKVVGKARRTVPPIEVTWSE